jgi:protein involved in polysaccharide export with SLBB domain
MRVRWLLLALMSVVMFAPAALPQSSSTAATPQQLELLRSLSASDREALAKQLGIDLQSIEGGTETRRAQPGSAADSSTRGVSGEQDQIKRLEALRRELALSPGDTLVIGAAAREGDAAGGQSIERELIEDIRGRNPYRLDSSGFLQLPGLAPISLSGLSEQQSVARIEAEPSLKNLKFKISKLPVDKVGFEALKPFGYELFEDAPSTFAPVTDVPVPSGYLVGPGDELSIQLFGSQNRTVKLVVGRDGRLSVPDLGPISVGGKTFDAVRQDIENRVAAQLVGVRASVSMADTRSIRVFVMGEARQPGSYTVSGLATMTSALFASGGVTPTGSLRDIQLKRAGQLIRRLDLYDLLLRGDTGNDVQLMSGDVIFIPPVGPTVAIEGEVRRPAVYELRGSTTISSLLAIAGGLTEEADPDRAALVRLDDQKRRIAIDAPLLTGKFGNQTLRAGDRLRVPRLPPTLDSGVSLEGHLFRPGAVAWREGLRISAVIPSVKDLRPNADLKYVVIRREIMPDRRVVILSADLAAALRGPGSAADLLLSPRDRIIVFDSGSSRRPVIEPLLDELRIQSTSELPAQVVSLSGRVKAPGDYPLEPDMRVSDLLRAGGDLQDAAYVEKAELVRFLVDGGQRKAELLEIDLAAVLRGDSSADVALNPFDTVLIKEIPEWSQRESITLRGEVRFPGSYPIRRGETLRSVLERAGGLTGLAFTKGAVFSRLELAERERKQIQDLSNRLRADLASRAVQAGNLAAAGGRQAEGDGNFAVLQGLLQDLNNSKPVGRLVIDLDSVIAGPIGSARDVVLRDGDELVIPKLRQEVSVIGEVQNSTSHLYRSGLTRADYLGLSGGVTRRADTARLYVVRADGSVATSGRSWFGGGDTLAIQPGDTIVVPVDTERVPRLGLWQAVSTIIYNSAVALAAIRSL